MGGELEEVRGLFPNYKVYACVREWYVHVCVVVCVCVCVVVCMCVMVCVCECVHN